MLLISVFIVPVLILFFLLVTKMQKIFLIVVSVLVWSETLGQKCVDTDLDRYNHEMYSFIKKLNAKAALAYADSILVKIDNGQQSLCDQVLWIRLHQGEAYVLENKFEIALELYFDLLRKLEKSDKREFQAETYISIASAFEAIDRPKDSRKYLDLAFSTIKKYGLDAEYASYCLRNASYHRIYGSIDSAIHNALNSISLGKIYNVPRSVFDGHLLMGILSPELDSSVFHFREAIKLFVQNGDFNGASSQALNIGNKYYAAGNYHDAKLAVAESEAYIEQMQEKSKNYFQTSARIDQFKSLIFEKEGNIDSAYYYLKSSNTLYHQAQRIIDHEKINQSLISFAIEKEAEKVKNAEKVSYIYLGGLFIMGILMLVLSWSLFNIRKKRRQIILQHEMILSKNDDLNQSVQKQALLLSEVHHRVKNNLQLVISLLTLHGHKTNIKSVKNYLDDLSRKVFSIALIHEQLYRSGDFEKIDTKEYIHELTSNFQILQDVNQQVEFTTESERIWLNLETVLPLGIICSELISNSLKYACSENENIKIYISLKMVSPKYLLEYKDSGSGFPEELSGKSKQGMGFTLIDNMVRQLQGESSRYNDNGAIFTLLFEEKTVSPV